MKNSQLQQNKLSKIDPPVGMRRHGRRSQGGWGGGGGGIFRKNNKRLN